MPLPPVTDLNDPAAQAAEAERQRIASEKAAADKARDDESFMDKSDGSFMGNVAGGIADFGEGAFGAIDDAFSAEHVNDPRPGNWGTGGTPAAGYNASAVQKGAGQQQDANDQGRQALDGLTAEGQKAGNGGIAVANEMFDQAGRAGGRAAPLTNYQPANAYSRLGDKSRDTAEALQRQAGDSRYQEYQLGALNAFARQGPGASAAQAQLAASSDAAQAGALSMARSGRGAGDSASALRDATFSNAATQAQTGQAAAQLRAQEQASYRQQQLQALEAAMGGAGAIRGADAAATQLAQGQRSQDLQAQQQAAAQQQFLTQSQQQQTQINDAQRLGLLNTGLGYLSEGNQTNLGFQSLGQQTNLGYRQMGQGAAIDYAQLGQNALNSQADYELAQQQMVIEAAKANQQADLEKDSGITGMLSSAVGAMFSSDERRKKDVRRLSEAEEHNEILSRALETVGNAPAYSYRYKDPGQPGAKPGRMVGPMAQDLERGPLGDTLVIDTPKGKMVDTGRLSMLNSGAITALNDNDDETERRLEALERALGRKVA